AFWRDGKQQMVKISLGKLPDDKQQADAPSREPSKPTSLAALGLELAPASSVAGSGETGVVVTDVDPSGAAGESLRTGDVIVDVAGKPVTTPADVEKTIAAVKEDGKETVRMRVKSGEATRFVALGLNKG